MERPPIRPVISLGDIRLFECPLSAIPDYIWEEVNLVNSCVNNDGDIIHLPYKGTYLDQTARFRITAEVTKQERAAYLNEQYESKKAT